MQNGLSRVVIDTNILYIFLYNPESRAGRLIEAALSKKIGLFSTDSVKEEITRLMKNDFCFSENKISEILEYFPVKWIDKKIYSDFMRQAEIIRHKPDRPVLALAIALNCGIITANKKHFMPAKKIVKIWKIDELLKEIER